MAHILIIEDNPQNQELMTYLLRASGHEVSAEFTGGIAAAAARPPHLVVLDVQLPDCSGFDVLTELRSHPALAAVPVVAVTANAMVGDRDLALAAGFDGYLAKPVEPLTFSSSIDEYLARELRGHPPTPLHPGGSGRRDG